MFADDLPATAGVYPRPRALDATYPRYRLPDGLIGPQSRSDKNQTVESGFC